MRTIRITGTGRLKVHPDMTSIAIKLSGICSDYKAAMEELTSYTEEIKTALIKLGFEKSSIKTLRYNLSENYENYTEDNIRKQRFNGYYYSHFMQLNYESDNELLGKIHYSLYTCKSKPEISVDFFVKDEESNKRLLIANAVADSKAKAEVLTKAADVKLGEIQSIDYSWDTINMKVSRTMNVDHGDFGAFDMLNAIKCDIEPDDINLSDTVTVTWEIL